MCPQLCTSFSFRYDVFVQSSRSVLPTALHVNQSQGLEALHIVTATNSKSSWAWLQTPTTFRLFPLLIFDCGLSLLRPVVLGPFEIHTLLFRSFLTRHEGLFRKYRLGHRCVRVGNRSCSFCVSRSEFLLVDIGSTCLSLTNVQSPPLQACPFQERRR